MTACEPVTEHATRDLLLLPPLPPTPPPPPPLRKDLGYKIFRRGSECWERSFSITIRCNGAFSTGHADCSGTVTSFSTGRFCSWEQGALKLLQNCSGTALELLWSCSRTPVKRPMECTRNQKQMIYLLKNVKCAINFQNNQISFAMNSFILKLIVMYSRILIISLFISYSHLHLIFSLFILFYTKTN